MPIKRKLHLFFALILFVFSAYGEKRNLFETESRVETGIVTTSNSIFGNCYLFQTPTSAIEFPELEFVNELTFSAWIRPNNLLNQNLAIAGIPHRFWLRTTTLREIQFTQPEIYDNNTKGALLSNNVWMHIAISISLPNIKIYLNGKEIEHYQWKRKHPLTENGFYIGKDHWRENFQGKMANILLCKEALTETEISNIYNTEKTAINLMTDLIVYDSFDQNNFVKLPKGNRIESKDYTTTSDSIRGEVGVFNGKSSFKSYGTIPIDNVSSFSFWMNKRIDSPNTRGGLVALGHAFSIRQASNLHLQVTIPQVTDIFEHNRVLNKGRWYHVTVTYREGEKVVIYIDGKRTYTYPCLNYRSAEKALIVGNNLWYDYFDGQIDDLLIWGRVLSPNEIEQVYKTNNNQWKETLNPQRKKSSLLLFCISTTVALSLLGFVWHRKTNKVQFKKDKEEEILELRKAKAKIDAVVEQNLKNPNFTLNDFAREFHSSKTKLYNEVKATTGYSPKVYLRKKRLEKACELLSSTKLPIAQIIWDSGFESRAFFNKCFKESLGKTPTQYRKDSIAE